MEDVGLVSEAIFMKVQWDRDDIPVVMYLAAQQERLRRNVEAGRALLPDWNAQRRRHKPRQARPI